MRSANARPARKAEAEIEKLTEQLAKQKAEPAGVTKPVKLLSGLLPGGVLDALTVEQVSAKITALWQEKGNRKSNETAQSICAGSTDHAAARNLA